MMKRISEARIREIERRVKEEVDRVRVWDIHTHLYDPAFGGLLLWGLDELLVYHYLVAEVFRYVDMPYEAFWKLGKTRQAELIWDQLFLRHSPISEACRGVLTTLQALGLDVKRRDLAGLRRWFSKWRAEDYVDHCLDVAGVERVWMTNSPFDDAERGVWEKGFRRHDRFQAALRIDPILRAWPEAAKRLRQWGYRVEARLGGKTLGEVRRFLRDWCGRIDAGYVMVSMPAEFEYPGRTDAAVLLEKAVLPHCAEAGLPFALMSGARIGVNPALRLAGDGVVASRLDTVENLCAAHGENKFLVTVLSRESQHRLCVLARKFRNLHIFGCWWFTNVPVSIEDMTRMRLELLGLSVTPQHSDARVLDQVIYKWRHSRRIIGEVLSEKYADVARTGWEPSEAEIRRDVRDLFGGAFGAFCGRPST